MSKMNNPGLRRSVGAAAIAAVAAVGLATMGAGNAAAGPLPGGSKTTVGVDGAVVKLSRTGESVIRVPSQANNGAGRSAEVSANLFASYPKGTSGTLTTGYIIGCQIDVTGLKLGINGSIGGPDLDSPPLLPVPLGTLSGSLDVPLKPGEATVKIIGSKELKGSAAAIQYKRTQIDVQQCGGYAQARAITTLEVTGDYYIKTTLYGAPFSIG